MAKEWQLEFNVGMYKVMHFSKRNLKVDYSLNVERMQITEVQRDVDIPICKSHTLVCRSNKSLRKQKVFELLFQRG